MFKCPLSGSLVMTISPVPIYRPPSRGHIFGAGNASTFTSSPITRFSFTGASALSIISGGMGSLYRSFVFLIISSVERSKGSPMVKAIRLGLDPKILLRTLYPFGYPFIRSKIKAGLFFFLPAIYVIAVNSSFQSTSSFMAINSPISSTLLNQSLRSL